MVYTNKQLLALTSEANGMLSDSVYEEIYNTCKELFLNTVVEIGTAHGASTIALGLGAKVNNQNVKIWTVDTLGGKFSSRSKYGSMEDNLVILKSNLNKANLIGNVNINNCTSEEFFKKNQISSKIDLLMLDADGRIDRDLINFYPLLSENSKIIIDDVSSKIYLNSTNEGSVFIDNKHRITKLLLNAFVKNGYLKIEKNINDTFFCQTTNKDFNREEVYELALAAYRDLVICEVEDEWNELKIWYSSKEKVRLAIRFFDFLPIKVIQLLRRIKNIKI